MHRIALTLLLLIALAVSTGTTAAIPAAACDEGTPDDHAAALTTVLEEGVGGNHDLTLFDRTFAQGVLYHATSTTDANDVEGVKAIFASAIDAFPDLTYTVEQQVADGQDVAVIYRAEGTNTNDFRGIPATGKRVTWTGAMVATFSCGKAVEVWNASDRIGRDQQLGQWPIPTEQDPAEVLSAESLATIDDLPMLKCATPTPQTIRDAIDAHLAAMTPASPLPEMETLFHPRVVHHRAEGSDLTGIPAAQAWLDAERGRFTDLTITHTEPIIRGDLAAIRWTAVGTTSDGRRAEWDGISVYWVACDRVREVWIEGDVVGMLDQLGELP